MNPTHDPWLARIVAAGLILLAAGAVAGSVLLRAHGVEAPEITGVAASGVGALASFFAGVALGSRAGESVTASPVATRTATRVSGAAGGAGATDAAAEPVAPKPPATDVRHI